MSSVGRISLDLSVNNKKFDKQVDGIQKKATKSFGLMSVAIGNIMANMAEKAIASVGNFVKDSINKGSEIAELQNVVDTVFTNMADKVDSFAKSSLASYGLTEKQSKKMMGTFGAMSKSFGYSEQQAFDMSAALTGLTGDVASFYNLNHDEAYTKLKSVFTGETESLKELGVVMTQSALDAFAIEKGFTKTTNAMSEQEKVALRLAFVQDKLSVAAGDFSKTQHQWANQVRILSGQFETFQSVLGQGFINVLTPIIRALNTFMSKLIQAANVFKAFTEMITGNKSSGGIGTAMKDVANAAESAASSTGGIEDSANGAAKAAKQAQKSLMGFDEINKLTKPSDSSGAGGSGISGGSIDIPETTFSPIEETTDTVIDKILEKFKNINFDPLKKSFNNLKDSILPVLETIGNAVKWFFNNVLVPLGTWVIEDALPAFFNALAGVFDVLNPLLIAVQAPLKWLWDNFLKPIASWTGGVIVAVLETIGKVLSSIGTWMSNNISVVEGMTSVVLGFFAAWKAVELMSFIQQSGGVVAALKTMLTWLQTVTVAKIKDKLETMALTALYAKDFIVSVAKGTAELVKQGALWVKTTALKVADKVATIASTAASTAMTAATWALNGALAVLTSPITLVIAAIAALVAGIILLVKNFDTVKKVATDVFQGMWKVIKTIINAILGGVESLVNGLINGVNAMVRALNKLSFKVPDWVPSIGGKNFGLNLKEANRISLPRLAEGGYVRANQPQPVIIGDNKTQGEIVSPVDKMRETMIDALEMFFSKLQQSGYKTAGADGSVGDIVIPIYLDGTLLDETIVTAQQRRNLRSGGR